ncbi:G-type lectin S-receptor-like serine/threonine-protein kinase [Camellia lanceoleosa]|uniref:G-type lectin S-receptor-like serine/threonine-protein kinase n=1 Tax=Camellia lanceoleosa TaxID=1840588 RepID=A0ACC0G1M0_9ERIC|nr:G-type lectin S-receptor-like serine/threonine-protein kinase [Camellia lanceoleosa]
MEQTGQITQRLWLANLWNWKLFWVPVDQSEVYAFCGAFGIFNVTSLTHCACLPGFVPLSPNETQRLNDWSGGCVRKTCLQCESNISNAKNDGFLKISNLKSPPANSKAYPARNGKQCESACSLNCSCIAYAYNGSECSIWDGALLNLRLSDGNMLAASELQDVGGILNPLLSNEENCSLNGVTMSLIQASSCSKNYQDAIRDLEQTRKLFYDIDYKRIAVQVNDAKEEVHDCKNQIKNSASYTSNVKRWNKEFELLCDVVKVSSKSLSDDSYFQYP